MHAQTNPRGSVVVAALTHFAIVALSSAVAAYVIGVLSVFAYLLWARGWAGGLWVLDVLS